MEQALPDNMVLFGRQISPIIMTGLRIMLIVVAGWIILILIQKLIRTFRTHLTLYAGQLRDGSSPPFNLSRDTGTQLSRDSGKELGGAR